MQHKYFQVFSLKCIWHVLNTDFYTSQTFTPVVRFKIFVSIASSGKKSSCCHLWCIHASSPELGNWALQLTWAYAALQPMDLYSVTRKSTASCMASVNPHGFLFVLQPKLGLTRTGWLFWRNITFALDNYPDFLFNQYKHWSCRSYLISIIFMLLSPQCLAWSCFINFA